MKHTARNLNEFGFAYLKKMVCLLACGSLLTLAGCGTLTRFPAPIDKMDEAQIPGITNIRANGDTFSPAFQRDMYESGRQLPEKERPIGPDGKVRPNVLVISGGGANGAFGAGILYGWTKSGKRPRFKLVTGISTGGLSAPFAFLGPKYDERLKALYTGITSSKDIFRLRSIFKIIGKDSFADVTPLKKLIYKHIDETILKAIARQHRRGYRLYIGTTNLDTQRFVIWNMGRIADSGHPDALKLFRNVMLASASIPGAFPPVYIKVKVGDKLYDEMHVDGGLRAQLFFYGSVLNVREFTDIRLKSQPSVRFGGVTVYVIRNGYLRTSYKQTRRKLKEIIGRTISTMTKQAAINDLVRVYAITMRDKGRFYYIGIPDDFIPQAKEAFDQVEMRRLFKLGEEMASDKNFKWNTLPPGFDTKSRHPK